MEIKCNYDKLIAPKDLTGLRHPRNNNKHPKDQVLRLVSVIEANHFRKPIVVSKLSNVITAGHARLDAAIEAGWAQVPVVYQDYDSPEQEYQDLTADNAIAFWSEIDYSMINTDLKAFDNIDINALGLKDFNIEPETLEPQCDEDDVPELKHDPITKRGDVWLLGKHRVMCGDSTMIDDVEKLMAGEKADMVFTDPPYNVNYESKHTGKILNDKMSDEDFEQFIRDVYSCIDAATGNDSSIYICHATMVIAFDTVLREMGWEINNKIIWVKDIPTFTMARYKWKYEPIHFCLKGKPKFYGDKTQTNVWEIKSIQSAGNIDDDGKSWFKGGSKNLTLHPTQKPFQLPLKAIENSSRVGQLLFEPFCGSGSTLIACEKTNRKCYGMELDEHYCDVIINRWQKYTGNNATLSGGKETYNELKVKGSI